MPATASIVTWAARDIRPFTTTSAAAWKRIDESWPTVIEGEVLLAEDRAAAGGVDDEITGDDDRVAVDLDAVRGEDHGVADLRRRLRLDDDNHRNRDDERNQS